jgi:hypothetical protein
VRGLRWRSRIAFANFLRSWGPKRADVFLSVVSKAEPFNRATATGRQYKAFWAVTKVLR